MHLQLLSDDGHVEETALVDGTHQESDRPGLSKERPGSPKKIIGDIFALAMWNHVAVGHGDQTYFTIGAHTVVIITGVLPEDGLVARKSIQSSRPVSNPFS